MAGSNSGNSRFPAWARPSPNKTSISSTLANTLFDILALQWSRTEQLATLAALARTSKAAHAVAVPHLYHTLRLTAFNAGPLLAGLKMPHFDRAGARLHDVQWGRALAHWVVLERPKRIPAWVCKLVARTVVRAADDDMDLDDEYEEGEEADMASTWDSDNTTRRKRRSAHPSPDAYPSPRSHALKMSYLKLIANLHVETLPPESECHSLNILFDSILSRVTAPVVFPGLKQVTLLPGAMFQLATWQGDESAPMHPFLRTLATGFRPDHLCAHALPHDDAHAALYDSLLLPGIFHGPGANKTWDDVLETQPVTVLAHLLRSWDATQLTIHGGGRQAIPGPRRGGVVRVFLVETTTPAIRHRAIGESLWHDASDGKATWEWIYPADVPNGDIDEVLSRREALFVVGANVVWSAREQVTCCGCCGEK